MDTQEFRQGDVIAGKFKIDRIIGEGGMGVVAVATHLELRESVALKFLRKEVLENKPLVARFANEARALVKLKGEHVARVIDVGQTDAGIPFIVMEYLVGQDLGAILDKQTVLPVTQAVEYVIQACEAFTEAHARGIVHQDIKPANLFLVERDGLQFVKVLDFGISKTALAGTTREELEAMETKELMGSPTYMAPEQLDPEKEVDSRTDLWAVGVLLFELLTGQTPFDDGDLPLPELLQKILSDPPRKITSLRTEVSPELQRVIEKCLAKDPEARYQNAAELSLELLPFAPRRSRVVVEKSISVARSAGMRNSEKLALPPSIIPPSVPASGSGVVLGSLGPKNATPQGISSDMARSDSKKGPPWVAIGAGAVALLIGVGVVMGGKSKANAVADTPATTAPAVKPTETAAAATQAMAVSAPETSASAAIAGKTAPKEAIAQIRVETEPPGARITENGVELCARTPCVVTFNGEAVAQTHEVQVSKFGYKPEAKTLPHEGAATWTLEKAATTRPHSVPAASPTSGTPKGFKETPY